MTPSWECPHTLDVCLPCVCCSYLHSQSNQYRTVCDAAANQLLGISQSCLKSKCLTSGSNSLIWTIFGINLEWAYLILPHNCFCSRSPLIFNFFDISHQSWILEIFCYKWCVMSDDKVTNSDQQWLLTMTTSNNAQCHGQHYLISSHTWLMSNITSL